MGRHGAWPEGDRGKVPGLIPDRRATAETAGSLSPDAVAGIKQTMRRSKASQEGVPRSRRQGIGTGLGAQG